MSDLIKMLEEVRELLISQQQTQLERIKKVFDADLVAIKYHEEWDRIKKERDGTGS